MNEKTNIDCDFCIYCIYCTSCTYCNSCDFCNSCDSCTYCIYCTSCKNLKMTEYNYFCWSEEYNDDKSFQQPRYRVFNKQVTKEEYFDIKRIYHKLEFDSSESYKTRYTPAFKKMWNKLTPEEQQEYLDIPFFSWEGFTYITGIRPEDVKSNDIITVEGKRYKLMV